MQPHTISPGGHRARPHPGQGLVAERLRTMLAGSTILEAMLRDVSKTPTRFAAPPKFTAPSTSLIFASVT